MRPACPADVGQMLMRLRDGASSIGIDLRMCLIAANDSERDTMMRRALGVEAARGRIVSAGIILAGLSGLINRGTALRRMPSVSFKVLSLYCVPAQRIALANSPI